MSHGTYLLTIPSICRPPEAESDKAKRACRGNLSSTFHCNIVLTHRH